jgi:rhodanese-related sulfurtransferase
MIHKTLIVILITVLAVFSTPVGYTYDHDMAASYAALFQQVTGAKAGKELHLLPPDKFVEKLKKGQKFVAIDIRTEKESELYTMSLPGSMAIPMNKLFEKQNLKRIPTDKPVVVVCKSGTRASAAGTALRHIGFKNVYILKGGFKALNAYMGPKEIYAPLPVKLGSTH